MIWLYLDAKKFASEIYVQFYVESVWKSRGLLYQNWLYRPTLEVYLLQNFKLTLEGSSLVAQTVKNLPAMQETQVQPLGLEDPLEKEMANHSSILALRTPWTVWTPWTVFPLTWGKFVDTCFIMGEGLPYTISYGEEPWDCGVIPLSLSRAVRSKSTQEQSVSMIHLESLFNVRLVHSTISELWAYRQCAVSIWCLKFCLLVVLNQLQKPGHCLNQCW